MFNLGVILALVALVCWGFGDFFMQRSARKFGDWESLFIVALVGSIILLPFVVNDIFFFLKFHLDWFYILLLIGVNDLISTLVNVEALKRGKLAVVESVGAAEILVAGILSYFIFGESLDLYTWGTVLLLIFGILLVALKPHHFKKETWIEKGALLAILGAIFMGITDFSVALGARITNPIFTIWFFNLFIAIVSMFYLAINGNFGHFLKDLRLHKDLMGVVGILDNIAWLSFAAAMTFIPVVIALALSESYIILAALLGLVINKEKLQLHQFAGIIICVTCVIILSVAYG